MKKTLILLALIITTFAIAKNTDDSNKIKSYLKPPTPFDLKLKPGAEQRYNSITFSWQLNYSVNGNSELHHYEMYLYDDDDATDGTIPFSKFSISKDALEYTFDDSQFLQGRIYEIVLRTFDVNNNFQTTLGNYPPEGKTNPLQPVLSANQSITQITTQGFDINFTASISPEIIGYYFYANGFPCGFSIDSSYTVNGLQPNTDYSINVKAINQYGFLSLPSNIIPIKTLNYAPPNLEADNVAYSADNYIKQVNFGADGFIFPYSPRTSPAGIAPKCYNDFTVVTQLIANLVIGEQYAELNKFKYKVANNSFRNAALYIAVDYDYNGVFDKTEIFLEGDIKTRAGTSCGLCNVKSGNIEKGLAFTFVGKPIAVPLFAYSGTVRMRIFYMRHDDSTVTPQATLQNIINTHASGLVTNGSIGSSNPDTSPVGEIEDFNVLLSRPPTINEKSISNPVANYKEKSKIPDKIGVNNFTLYPNPVSDDILNITIVEDYTPYRILNTLGQEVGSGTVKDNIISVTKLAQGMYIIELVRNKQRIVKRFIKQ